MPVTLPPNKKQRAIDAVESLLSVSTVSLNALESALGFLLHCCQVVPLGHPFLHQLFSLLCRCSEHNHFCKIRIPRVAKEDLHWWRRFLESWSTVSLIQPSHQIHDVTKADTSELRALAVYTEGIFSPKEFIPSIMQIILIGKKCLLHFMPFSCGMNLGMEAWFALHVII